MPARTGIGDIRVGISGWHYAEWRKTFYPPGWPQSRELEYASRVLRSVELNGSFYSLQRPESYQAWYEATPDDFIFAVKGSRFISHMKRLADVERPLANFLASGCYACAKSWGRSSGSCHRRCASMRRGSNPLSDYCHATRGPRRPWPGGTTIVSAAGRGLGPTRIVPCGTRWRCDTSPSCAQSSSRCYAAIASRWSSRTPRGLGHTWRTSPQIFVYVRLHGDSELYVSGYMDAALDTWARRVRRWARGETSGPRLVGPPALPRLSGRDVFVYFDNDAEGRAPFDAMGLSRRLKAVLKPSRSAP